MVSESYALPNVSRETNERLKIYADLLVKWNPKINLISKSSVANLWQRHFVDSAQIWSIAPKSGYWLDIGSGGGFPGLVIAAIASDECPSMRIGLVESDSRKATFLRTAAREMGINAEIHISRIENLAPQNADVLSARALAPLSQLCSFAERHLSTKGCAVFPKGEKAVDEIETALANWQFEVETYPSVTDKDASILKLKGISRVRPAS